MKPVYGYLHLRQDEDGIPTEYVSLVPDPSFKRDTGRDQEPAWYVGDEDQGYYPFATKYEAEAFCARPSRAGYYNYLLGRRVQ